jgi:hypothetical protein
MKKILIVVILIIGLSGCYKDDFIQPIPEVKEQLQIKEAV